MINRTYADHSWEQAAQLLAIDSPTGYTHNAAAWVKDAFAALGYEACLTVKGGVLVDLGGREDTEGLLLQAHIDTLGGMIRRIKADGRLQITSLGGMRPENCEGENVRVHTRDGKVIDGTFQFCNASVHVNPDYKTTLRSFDNTEVVLDEDVHSAADTRALGIEVGDFVCFDPRTRKTKSGYLKSRYLDDKLCVGILLGFAKYLAKEAITLPRRTWVHITVYEEVGHGAATPVPAGVTEVISLDMGCVGDGLNCTEKQVSICAKDAASPYNYDVVTKLINAAKATQADYAIDFYPFYSSDVDVTLKAGYDVRHGLIGPGVYASHGYERSHLDGVYNTLKVICGYLGV